jgi:hypothetical protein
VRGNTGDVEVSRADRGGRAVVLYTRKLRRGGEKSQHCRGASDDR